MRLSSWNFDGNFLFQNVIVTEEKRQKRKEQQLQQQQAQQPPTPGAPGPSLRPCAPPGMNAANVPRPMGPVQSSLRSHSPGMGQLGLTNMAMQQNRVQFGQQAQQMQAQQIQAQQQAQQQQQQGMMVGPAGPSPNGQSVSNANIVANPGLSPFGQAQMSQANLTTTTASVTTSQFPTSNGTTGLSNSSPIHNQNQFDLMKARLAQAQVRSNIHSIFY